MLIIFLENYYSNLGRNLQVICMCTTLSLGFHSEFCTRNLIGAARQKYYSSHIERNTASLNEMGWCEDVGIMPQHQTIDWLKCIIFQDETSEKPTS